LLTRATNFAIIDNKSVMDRYTWTDIETVNWMTISRGNHGMY
jgi:hypothetical protein